MRIGKVVWWIAVILLIFGAVACARMAKQIGSMQSELLIQFATSIEQNPTVWKAIEIAGTQPLYFQKDMWINNHFMRVYVGWSTVFFSLLMVLLSATVLYEKRKTRESQKKQ